MTIPVEKDWRADSVAAAVSDRGDVIVTWREESTRFVDGPDRVPVPRRARGPGRGVRGRRDARLELPAHEVILPAIAATGEAFVLTSTAEGTGP